MSKIKEILCSYLYHKMAKRPPTIVWKNVLPKFSGSILPMEVTTKSNTTAVIMEA